MTIMERKTNTADEVPHLDITIHEDTLRVDVKNVIDLLRSKWNIDQLVLECKSDGYLNKNYHCHMGDSKDGLFVRLAGTKLKEDLLKGGIKFMTYLRRRGMGAKLLCTFTNGLVMEYVPGETISWQGFRRLKEEHNWLGAARELARYHGTTNLDDIRELGIMTYKERLEEFGEQLKATMDSGIIPKDFLQGLPSVDELQEMRKGIYTQLENMNAELCFCHFDPNPTNFIITDQGPMLVDYDSCTYDFAASNIGYFFFLAFDLSGVRFEEQPTESEKDAFLREYLEQRRLMDLTRGHVTEKQVRYWKYLAKKGELLVVLNAIGWFIIGQAFDKKLGELSHSRAYWDRFLREKYVLQEIFLDE